MELQKLMEVVEANWHFDGEKYPHLPEGLDIEAQQNFILKHILLHQQKTLGKLAEICESVDHGAEMDLIKLGEVAGKMFVNTLRLAMVSGMPNFRLEVFVQEWGIAQRQKALSERQAGP